MSRKDNIEIAPSHKKKKKLPVIIITICFIILLISFIVFRCTHIPLTFQIAVGDISEIQQKIDMLEKKAIKGEYFSIEEKNFCVKVFDSLTFGGRVMGYREASEMLSHYIHGNGIAMETGKEAFVQNKKVQQACRQILLRLEADIRAQRWHEKHRYGSPTLFISQDEDSRLFYLSNVFEVTATAKKTGKNSYRVEFRVDRFYQFSSYQAQIKRFDTPKHLVSYFPTSVPGKTLTIDDGLSEYLVSQGIAKEFDYFAVWEDELKIF
ncbi:MAG: hypothetical protein JW904_11940 [Spirochaetales bacterium]|nr:hypothetical protein [Spirochaetales bacterium]